MKKPAVFVDRDGTLNEQMGYINHISRFVLLPGSAEAIKILNRNRYLTIVVSNQSGVARGYFPIQLVEDVHSRMRKLLEREGAVIDRVLFCPHYRKGSVPEYSIDCECRKPRTGLIKTACETFDIDMARSYVIGDRLTDIQFAHAANLKGILVKSGYGLGEIDHLLPFSTHKPAYIAENLLAGVRWILNNNHDQKL